MRAKSHHGRPGTTVIPSGWSAHHRPVVEATLQSTCAIRHAGGTTAEDFDRENLVYPEEAAAAAHWTGACTVTDLTDAGGTTLAGDQVIPTATYLVEVAHDAASETAIDDVITITAAGPNADPTLAGVELVVESIGRASRAWTRAFFCTENQSPTPES